MWAVGKENSSSVLQGLPTGLIITFKWDKLIEEKTPMFFYVHTEAQ